MRSCYNRIRSDVFIARMELPSYMPTFHYPSSEGSSRDEGNYGDTNQDYDNAVTETAQSHSVEEVAQIISDGVERTPDAPATLIGVRLNLEVTRMFSNFQHFSSTVNRVIREERGRRGPCCYDRIPAVTQQLLGADTLRGILVELNDKTMEMVDIATIAGVELFVAGVTDAIYMTFGK